MADEDVTVTTNDVLVDDKGEIIEKTDSLGPQDTDEGDERLAASESDSDEEQGHAEETAEEAEARRERNRQRRKENKERRKDYIEGLKRELSARDEILSAQQARLDALERRTHSTDVAAIDTELKKTADAYQYFKGQIDIAVRENNGAAVTEAIEKMSLAQKRFDQLNNIKQTVANRQQAPQPLDPVTRTNAESWYSRNQWYNPDAKDMDSRLVREIDATLVEEGWNPKTTQYWEELDTRIKRYLPHRVNQGYNKSSTNSQGRPPVAGSGRDSTGGSAQGSYRLSADRVEALKQAGVWDDPAQRAEAIKRYKEYDRAAARN